MNQHLPVAVVAQAGVPALLWGGPGIGKTAYVHSMARAFRVPLELIIGSLHEPSDIFGVPIVVGDEMVRSTPDWAKRLMEAGKGIAFFDELTTSPPAVQAPMLTAIHERRVGRGVLPAAIMMMAAANPPEQAAAGYDLTPPLANRFWHYLFALDPTGWSDGMISGWPQPRFPILPPTWELAIGPKRAIIASFIHHRPTNLYALPKDEASAGNAWPSPRTWDMAARLLAAGEAVKLNEVDTNTLIAGAVGNGAAMEFLTWQRELDLPDPEDLLANPSSYKHPRRGDQAFAILSSVVTAALGNLTKERWLAAWEVLTKAGDAGAADLAAQAVRALAQAKTPQRGDLVMPFKQLEKFYPILQAAGLMSKAA